MRQTRQTIASPRAAERSEFMNSLTSIELFFKGRLSRMRARAGKLKNRSPPRQFFKRSCRRCHRRCYWPRCRSRLSYLILLFAGITRTRYQSGVPAPGPVHRDSPGFDEYEYIIFTCLAERAQHDSPYTCELYVFKETSDNRYLLELLYTAHKLINSLPVFSDFSLLFFCFFFFL